MTCNSWSPASTSQIWGLQACVVATGSLHSPCACTALFSGVTLFNLFLSYIWHQHFACAYACTRCLPTETKRRCQISETGVTGSCKPVVGDGNWTQAVSLLILYLTTLPMSLRDSTVTWFWGFSCFEFYCCLFVGFGEVGWVFSVSVRCCF